jgi:hypothetical protein
VATPQRKPSGNLAGAPCDDSAPDFGDAWASPAEGAAVIPIAAPLAALAKSRLVKLLDISFESVAD